MEFRRETIAFCVVLATGIAGFFHASLLGGKVLSPADVLLASASVGGAGAGAYEPANRLLMDPVLQFEPWLDFNRSMIRAGRLPLWNGYAGCGVPHLANGQSAVFDPFHWIAYLGRMPEALVWIASGRLFAAGLGAFLLASAWKLGVWGRWFAGLVYPFCGFLVVWLLYPVTSVAIWMPWLLLATDRVVRRPGPRSSGWLAVAVALVVVGGHIQTSAHVLLAGLLYLSVLLHSESGTRAARRRAVIAFGGGVALGMAVAAVQIVTLGVYLTKSTVWGDRQRERPPWWSIARPRLLDSVCTALPYAFGSQRRGHPHLGRALGVHNLNESAGGYAGLATLIWLAPVALMTSWRAPPVRFLAIVAATGALAAFRLPPVDNLLRALPVLQVTDNRRLTLWLAFALSMLGAFGIDRLEQSGRLARQWVALWAVAAGVLALAAVLIHRLEPVLFDRARAHYQQAALDTPGADAGVFAQRAVRQVRHTLRFIPRYHGLMAVELAALAAAAAWLRRGARRTAVIRPALFTLALLELWTFGYGLNPETEIGLHRMEPAVIARLRAGMPPGARAIGVGEELPPNVLMRFGLSDPRCYDSIELARSLAWWADLYDSAQESAPRSSRSAVTWETVIRARDRLAAASVAAAVGSTAPPEGHFQSVERVGAVWIAWLEARPWADSASGRARISAIRDHGRARILIDAPTSDRVTVRETWDPGWRGTLDGKEVKIGTEQGVFLDIHVPSGQHQLILKYDPAEVRWGLGVSSFALVIVILVLTGIRLF